MKRASNKDKSRPLKNTTVTKGRIPEVSDAQAVREIIATICKSRGFEVIQACDGDEALNVYRKLGPLRARAERFVLVRSWCN